MAFRDFGYPEVLGQLGLTLTETDLFSAAPPAAVPGHFADQIAEDVTLAAAINTEKARSEFIIAPVLRELRRQHPGQFALFSGTALNVDPARGLNGVCDFLLSRTPIQSYPAAPLMALVEAKNDDPRTGYGQCVASMVAAREFNRAAGADVPAVYGACTSGVLWVFLRLVDTALTLDLREYQITDLPRILGILSSIVRRPPAAGA